jgi:uncharacterized RDD family membrane protein YckC
MPVTTPTTSNRYAPPRATVRDYVQSRAVDDPADRSTRLAAALLDSVILAAMVYMPLIVAIGVGGITGAGDGGGTNVIPIVGVVLTLVGFIAWCWLTIKYVICNGQSIAKKILSIKVVRSDGSPITLGRLFWLRNVVNGLISIVPLYGLIELLFIFSESRQCLHDKLADTIVVKA